MSRYATRSRRSGFPFLILLSVACVVLSVVMFVSQLIAFTQLENRLSTGVTIGGVDVSNLTQQEAADRVENAFSKPVTVYFQDQPINITPDSIGFRLSLPVMIANALASSENNGGFWQRFTNYMLGRASSESRNIALVADYQESTLRTQLEQIAAIYDRPAESSNFDLTTLTTYSGGSGVVMNVDSAVGMVDSALRSVAQRWVDLPVTGGTTSQATLQTLRSTILAYLDAKGFIYDGQTSVASVYIQDLTSGEEISILGDVAFTAASTMKVPILIDYFRVLDGEVSQDNAWLMANSLLCSANSTSNLIMSDIIGQGDIFRGIADVTRNANYSGARNTYLTAPFVDGSPDQQFGSIAAPTTQPNPNFNTSPDTFNQTTAEDMGTLFQMIYDCANRSSGLLTAYPDGDFTPRECRQMLELMSGLRLERLLEGGVPPGTRIAYKNGWVGEVTGVAGIVYPPNGRDYIISIYIWEDTGATGFQDYIRLWPIIEDISRAAWNYFEPDQALLQPRTDLPTAAQECQRIQPDGSRTSIYLPPYGEVNLDDIDGWKQGSGG